MPFLTVDLGERTTRSGLQVAEWLDDSDDHIDEPSHHLATAGYSRGRIVDVDAVYQLLSPQLEGVTRTALTHGLPSALAPERTLELLFDLASQEHVTIGTQGNMDLMATGRTSGITVGVGYGMTQVCAVWEGMLMQNVFKGSSRYLEIGVKDVSMFGTCVDTDGLVLPDGSAVLAGSAADLVSRIPVPSDLIGINPPADVHGYMEHIMDDLLNSICLTGGGTLENSFKDKMTSNLKWLFPGRSDLYSDSGEKNECGAATLHVVAAPERIDLAWLGTTIIATLDDTPWLSRAQFQEAGANGMRRFYFEQYQVNWEPFSGRQAQGWNQMLQPDPIYSHPVNGAQYWDNIEVIEET